MSYGSVEDTCLKRSIFLQFRFVKLVAHFTFYTLKMVRITSDITNDHKIPLLNAAWS